MIHALVRSDLAAAPSMFMKAPRWEVNNVLARKWLREPVYGEVFMRIQTLFVANIGEAAIGVVLRRGGVRRHGSRRNSTAEAATGTVEYRTGELHAVAVEDPGESAGLGTAAVRRHDVCRRAIHRDRPGQPHLHPQQRVQLLRDHRCGHCLEPAGDRFRQLRALHRAVPGLHDRLSRRQLQHG